jgi:hypothetical protein
MEKGFKTLKGVRVMLSIPKKEESIIQLDPKTKKEMDKEFVESFKSLEVYAVGDAVALGGILYTAAENNYNSQPGITETNDFGGAGNAGEKQG